MNQIIYREKLSENSDKNVTFQRKRKIQIYFIFGFSLFVFFLFMFYFLLHLYYINHSEQLAKKLSHQFEMATLYANSSSNSNTILTSVDANTPSIIGNISIPKLNINYYIFSETTDALLKIAPCRFFGPLPNEIGNLCIAGHNYDNSKFFSKIYQLEKGDSIDIKDISGTTLTYSVYEMIEIPSSDGNRILHQPSDKKEITLITCNNKNGNRIIVKALAP